MMCVRRSTLFRNRPFIAAVIRKPPETWDEHFVRALYFVQLRIATECQGAEEELRELGEIITAFRATEAYQNRAH